MDSWSTFEFEAGINFKQSSNGKLAGVSLGRRTFSLRPLLKEPGVRGTAPGVTALLRARVRRRPAWGSSWVTEGQSASFLEKYPGFISSFRVCLQWCIYFIFLVKNLTAFFSKIM